MNKRPFVIVGVLALLAAAAGYAWFNLKDGEAVQYKTARIERGNVQATVSASGVVNPVSQVSVGTQVSGQLKEVLVDFNSLVKAGQLLAQIDPETFEYRVRSELANVDAARAQALTVQATIAATRVQMSRAQLELDEARRDWARKESLVAQQFIAQSEADKARAASQIAAESLRGAQAQLTVNEAQLKSAQANVAQREAILAQARIDLERTKIRSPVSGIVIKRSVEKGQTVAASLQSPELFVIAQNLSDMQVDTSIDESDIGKVKTGQKATFTVDAFAGQIFEGEVKQVRNAAQTVANVVTYTAVIGFSNAAGRLLPGMTANVRVITDARDGVLKVPNTALRMRIAGVEPPVPAASAPQAPSTLAASSVGPAAQPPAGEGASPGAGGLLGAFRARLAADLALTPAQLASVDALFTQVRPKFATLRELPEAERPKGRERILGEMRAQIGDLLTVEQKPKYQALLAQLANRQQTRGRIYLMGADGKPKAVNVRLGISDGTFTELLAGPANSEVQEGSEVIVGLAQPGAAGGQGTGSGQRSGGAPRLPF